MRPSDQTLWHEAAHVAAARCLGLDARVTFHNPAWDDGDLARTHLEGHGDRSPLARSIISYAPVHMVVGPGWESPAFAGDRAIVEKDRPRHWPAEVWEFHIAEKTRELILTERFRLAFHEACLPRARGAEPTAVEGGDQ